MDYKYLFIPFLIFVSCFSLYGLEKETDVYTVGISVFEGVNLSGENIYLEKSLPLLIAEALSSCEIHRFSESEITEYRELLIKKEKESLLKQKKTLIEQLDSFFFMDDEKEDEIQQLEKKIEDIDFQAAQLNELDRKTIPVSTEKPISFPEYSENERLFPPPVLPPYSAPENKELDLFIGGFIEEVEKYFQVTVYTVSIPGNREVIRLTTAGSGDTLYNKFESVFGALKEIVLGRSWSTLSVRTDPENALIFLDGEFLGTGLSVKKNIEPGDHRIKITADNYQSQEHTVTLQSGDENVYSYSLIQKKENVLALTSYPGGADIYAGSQWLGKTPAILTDFETIIPLTLRKENFRDFSFLSTAVPPSGDFRFTLSPASLDVANYIDSKRNAMYGAFSLFIGSIPLPIIFYHLSQEYASGFFMASNKNNNEEMLRMYNTTSMLYHSYVGTFIVSASLFINSVVHLVEYIHASRLDRRKL